MSAPVRPPTSELERQQSLLEALWSREAAEALLGRCAPGAVAASRGLQAYRANAGAAAERALAAAFPVVQALVGAASFAALARACWQARAPREGDLARFGAALPVFLETDRQLADVPYLVDVARLEWALAGAEAAPDLPGSAAARHASLALLAELDPDELVLELAAGARVVRSAWPIVTLWRAHRPGADGLEAAREAVAARQAEIAFVWRQDWVARVESVDEASARFLEGLVAGARLDVALAQARAAAPDWSFEDWLGRALGAGWTAGARAGPPPAGPP